MPVPPFNNTDGALPPAHTTGRTNADICRQLAQRVRRLRRDRQWSQADLAQRCGLHRNYIGMIEHARRNPSLRNVCRVAEALGVSIMTLLGEDDVIG